MLRCTKTLLLTLFLVLFVAVGWGQAATKDINLNEGWNLVNTSIQPSDPTLDNILTGIDYISAWKWVGNSWAVNLSAGSTSDYAQQKGFQILSTINAGEGFWLNMNGADTLSINGDSPSSSSIYYENGWNLVGLRQSGTKNITDIFPEQGVSAWSWSSTGWNVYLPSGLAEYAQSKGFGELETVSDSDGFWVNAGSSDVNVSGVAAKGPFQKGTQVQAFLVQATGERGESIWSGEIQDQGGTFSFTPNDHTGLIELVINGTCLNELTDQMMNASLSAMFFLNDSLDEDIEVNINMATSMVVERCRHLLQEGWEPEDAFNRANSETATFFQNFLDLNSTSVEMITKGQENLSSAFNLMDIQEKPANGKFLLFNAALLQLSQDDNYPIQKVLEFLSTNNAFSASKTLTLSPSQLEALTPGGLAKLQSLELANPVQNRIANLIEQALNQNGTASDMVDFLQGTQHFAGNCTDLAFPDYSPALVTKTNAAGVAKAGNSTITVETDDQDKEGNNITVKSTNDTVEAELVSPDYTYGGASGQSGQDLYFAVQKVDPNKMPVEAKQTDCPECDEALANQNATQAPSNGTLQKPSPKVIASSNAKAQVIISDMQLGKDITVGHTL